MPVKSQLFSPFSLRGVEFRNRIVVAPMWQYQGKNGQPGDWHLMNLGRYAYGGAGLVFQEGTSVERRGCGTLGDIGIWDDSTLPFYKRLVSFIEASGAKAGIQLMHAGRKARLKLPMEGRGPLPRSADIPDWEAWQPIAPSALPYSEEHEPPMEMSLQDIADTQHAFVQAARRAHQAGYSVINLHGAHGYLIAQFLSEVSNARTDHYGGSFDNRIRYLLETVEGIRSVWPADKPLVLRLSCIDGKGWTLDDSIRLVRKVAPLGVDMIDCSSGGIEGSAFKGPLTYGYQMELARGIREATQVPTCGVGLIVHADHAESVLQEGAADMVALGRELIYNPNWPIDAAQKLGDAVDFSVAPPAVADTLRRRSASVPGFQPSTFVAGAHQGA